MFKSGGAREQGQTPPETALQEQLKQGRSLLLSSPRLATSDDSKIRASLWSLLVLIPSERSTGATVRRGGITKAGNGRVRHMLESAWTYRHPPRIGAKKLCRLKQAPPTVRDTPGKHRRALRHAIDR